MFGTREDQERGEIADWPASPQVVRITNDDGKSLRHSYYKIWANDFERDGLKEDFMWWIRPALTNEVGYVSFESVNYKGHFIARDNNDKLWLTQW